MAMNPKIRRNLIMGTLILTIAAAISVNQTEPETTVPDIVATRVSRHTAPPEAPGESDVIILDKLNRTPLSNVNAPADLFKNKSWVVLPPPKKPTPPPPPSAPPLPFIYIGKMIDDGVTTVFVSKQNRNYELKVGTIIDNTYRVDSITNRTATLTYLPLSITQTMLIGEPN